VVCVHTTFGPTIHHLSPRSTFSLPWSQLRDHSRKLSPEYYVSPQWTVTVDLVSICDLGAPTRFSANAKSNHPPTLRSTKTVPWRRVLPFPLAPTFMRPRAMTSRKYMMGLRPRVVWDQTTILPAITTSYHASLSQYRGSNFDPPSNFLNSSIF
jgi:hypothetical protein